MHVPGRRPQLSVIVPVFNEEESVQQVVPALLDSLSRQRRTFELIIVNDGSRDRTGELDTGRAAAENCGSASPRKIESAKPCVP